MKKLLIKGVVFGVLVLPLLVDAQGVVRMTGLPFEGSNNPSVEGFMIALYRIAIGIAAALAVLRLILAGAKYMLTDIVTQKSDAKRDIRSAIVGLLIVLGAVLILETINPQLLDLDALDAIAPVTVRVNPIQVNSIPDAEIGDQINECETNEQEQSHFGSTCPGEVFSTYDAASGCANLNCDTEAPQTPELSCSGTTCTCSFTEAIGSGVCVSQCALRDEYDYQNSTVDNTNQTVTCNFTDPNVTPNECAVLAGCCPTALAGGNLCVPSENPNICRVEQNTSQNQTCYYLSEE